MDSGVIVAILILSYIVLMGIYFSAYRFGYQEFKNKNYIKMVLGVILGVIFIVCGIIGIVLLSY